MPTFAAVDIGANSVRLKIARLDRRRLKIVHEDRQVTRLGESVFRPGGVLSPAAMADTVNVLRRFHRAAQKYAVDSVRVIATSALREAANRKIFIDWVTSATGWRVEIISGAEEARLIHLGLISNMRITTWPLLMVDLGGGSCELTISVRGHIRETISLPLGAVRLTNEFLLHDPPRKKELERLGRFIEGELGRSATRISAARVKGAIATSGTAAALAAVASNRYKDGRQGNEGFVSARAATQIARMLARRNLQQRTAFQGIGPRRAQIIVAGATVFAKLMERCHLKGFRYSPLGLRDGVLAQMAADYSRSARTSKQIDAERWNSVIASAGHYRVDLEHAIKVRDAAVQLFDNLARLHGLPPEYREWLAAAAMLSEVGGFLNRNGRHRHTYYIISHSEILGYNPQERLIIAAIARYLGKSRPAVSDPALKAIPAGDREHVVKASLLLRLANAINLGRGRVREVKARLHDPKVIVKIKPKRGADVELELWALERERGYFREVFGRELSTEVA
jgi:exopolyphosphatase/guanosine-5'-triphosphate,3'-diphosphate pyrophosphatase